MNKLKNLLEQQDSLKEMDLIKSAYDIFQSHIIATTSFGATSGVIIHLIWKSQLPIKVVYINTGFLFKETLVYIETIKNLYKEVTFVELKPAVSKSELLKEYGEDIFHKNPDLCCKINKVLPLNKYIEENQIKAWIAGLRKDQTDFRKNLQKITLTSKGLYKICPILNWTSKDVYYYMKANGIPFHPLYDKGYTSIGCEPCTDLPGDDERSGRWKGKGKKECGLHTEL